MPRDTFSCALPNSRQRADRRDRQVVPMLVLVFSANAAAWAWATTEWKHEPLFFGASVLAYGFGLRHAFDADHIACIDNVTRSLANNTGAPTTVGLWFALGHSMVVVSVCAAIALMIGQPQAWLPRLMGWGALGGSLFSMLFLCTAAGANALSLPAMLGAWRRGNGESAAHSRSYGLLAGTVTSATRMVSRPWHMLLVGLLFGLGFDTASEVGLLGLSLGTATHMPPQTSIMILPALFTAGMSLADAADGAMMARAYGWALERPQRRLAYNLVLTSLSVLAALAVAAVELGNIARQRYTTRGAEWGLIAWTSDHSGLFGALIIATLLGCWWLVLLRNQRRRRRLAPRDVIAARPTPS
jgi:high-affinity nickel-transport protein